MTYHKLWNEGLLFTSRDLDGTIIAMTVGWGLIGRVWRDPICMVAVRPTRYTHSLIEETNDCTVNVPDNNMAESVTACGTVSGRD